MKDRDEVERLSKSFSDVITKDQHPLDRFVKKVVSSILTEAAVPWLIECLDKYSEEDWHSRMSDPMWDFINDWETNHKRRFKAFMLGARKMRYAYDFNSQTITDKVIEILKRRNGWIIYDDEYVRLYLTLEQLRRMIEA